MGWGNTFECFTIGLASREIQNELSQCHAVSIILASLIGPVKCGDTPVDEQVGVCRK